MKTCLTNRVRWSPFWVAILAVTASASSLAAVSDYTSDPEQQEQLCGSLMIMAAGLAKEAEQQRIPVKSTAMYSELSASSAATPLSNTLLIQAAEYVQTAQQVLPVRFIGPYALWALCHGLPNATDSKVTTRLMAACESAPGGEESRCLLDELNPIPTDP